MRESAKLFKKLVDEVKVEGGREAVIDFTVNGVLFSLSACNGVMILWYDDEAQMQELFSDELRDRERMIKWLERGIADAIQ